METASSDKLTVAEVADMTGLSRASVLREISNGEFEAFRVGPAQKHIRVTRESVTAYMSRRRVHAPAEPTAA